MKNRYIALAACFALILAAVSGCAKRSAGTSPAVSEEPTASAAVSASVSESPQATPAVTTVKADSYKQAYLSQLNALIDQYGKFTRTDDGYPYDGVIYAALVDFEKDNVPEMVVVCGRKVYVYRYDASASKEIYVGQIGPTFGHTDVSYIISINGSADTPYLVTYNTTNEWSEETLTAFSLTNGKTSSTTLDAKCDGNNEYPDESFFTSFSIDGKTVSKSDYYALHDKIMVGADDIDVCWGTDPATEDTLNDFIAQLSK